MHRIDGKDIRELRNLYDTSASDYQYQIAEDEEFYLGQQLTEAQKDYLISVGQPPEINNKIRPAVETVLANISASSPEWNVKPVDPLDNSVANVYNTILDQIWRESGGNMHFRKACKDYIVKGLTYIYTYPDWNCDGGLGGLRISHIPTQAMYIDPNSMLPDFSDASSMIYSDLHTREDLINNFPQYEDIIKDAYTEHDYNEKGSGKYNRDQIMGRSDIPEDFKDKVRKFLYHEKIAVEKKQVTDLVTGLTQVYTLEDFEFIKSDERFSKMIDSGQLDAQSTFVNRIREVFVIGDEVAYDNVLPVQNYPIQPACNEHVGTPFPSGDVRHAKSPQRMLNRTEALIISHTNATANFKLVYEDGAVEPSEIAKWSVPNAVIRANPGALSSGKIKEFTPPSASNQLFLEKSRYEMDIEQVFGAYKYLQGSSADAPGTVGEASIVDEAVSRKQNWKVMPIYDMLTRTARNMLDYIPHVYNQQRSLRIVSPTGEENEIMLNQPIMDDKTGAVSRMYDMTTAVVDVEVVLGSTRAKSPMANLQKDLMLMNAGIYDKTEVIKNMTGNVDKVSLIQRHSEIAQLQQAVQSLEEQVKKLSGDMQTRERELFHANMRAEISEATKPVAQAVSNIKANAKIENEKQRAKTVQTGQDLAEMMKSTNSNNQAPAEG